MAFEDGTSPPNNGEPPPPPTMSFTPSPLSDISPSPAPLKNAEEASEDNDDAEESQDANEQAVPTPSLMFGSRQRMSTSERRRLRESARGKTATEVGPGAHGSTNTEDAKLAKYLGGADKEDALLQFVASINRMYQEKLHKPAPFMTFMILGYQSTGKSTLVERMLRHAINVVKEGTGTRQPLDITCIHDTSLSVPSCELYGPTLDEKDTRKELTVEEVFEIIQKYNKKLADDDAFENRPIFLVFRSSKVQNFRVVDTPGIISTVGQGRDNREDIKTILRSEIAKPNTKMCVLLEPKDFGTNAVINDIDNWLGGRSAWVDKAIFIMTKFDKQTGDSRSGSKANNFLNQFSSNGILPHLAMTPTLPSENLDPQELFEKRKELLSTADVEEKRMFDDWMSVLKAFLETNPRDETLEEKYAAKAGFKTAVDEMRRVMLKDTVERLPEVLENIRASQRELEKERSQLLEKQKYSDPETVKLQVQCILHAVESRIVSYLDSNLEVAKKFPEMLQTLDQEIADEEESDWAVRQLNHHTETEDKWRDHIARLANAQQGYPSYVQPEGLRLGGKQFQRAIEFFRAIMIDNLPEPHHLKDYVQTSSGYLKDNLQHENWEGAMAQITRVCAQEVTHPGINYLVKHGGSIFRRLFELALRDVKQGEVHSEQFSHLPRQIEGYLTKQFDEMLWELMVDVSNKCHTTVEPLYSIIDPNLPAMTSVLDSPAMQAFHAKQKANQKANGNGYMLHKMENDAKLSMLDMLMSKSRAFTSTSGAEAKRFLHDESKYRAEAKQKFLPARRSAMMTEEETNDIIQRSFNYLASLMEFNIMILRQNFNHFFYNGFKEKNRLYLSSGLVMTTNWDELVEPDADIAKRIEEIDDKLEALSVSQREVALMQKSIR